MSAVAEIEHHPSIESSRLIEHHPLAPFLPKGARVLMLGSFPPPRERWCMDFFYPNPQNDMWRIMGQVFFDDKTHFEILCNGMHSPTNCKKGFDYEALWLSAGSKALPFSTRRRRSDACKATLPTNTWRLWSGRT